MLVPFVPGVYVIEVDLEAGTVVVDWQQDYLS
jgi:ribosomal 30S subunit maturation factor RimM